MMLHWLTSLISKPLRRDPARQRQVDQQTSRLALYHFPICPYCIKVNRVIRKLNLKIEQRNAASDSNWADELQQFGGKLQTPCLKIQQQDGDRWLYESDDIIRYLRQNFATPEDLAKDPSA
ncbi:MAG: glutathione S-transferase N-terminal domain-containing protein [Candidatus Thiodiazotropha lotti]|uniref:glutathione S-transferase N-terminal domain-containing protein n=1 Tax=Candidatus Thiodiazotropha endoloripes TaxID=1818881 RepID=UPI00083CDF2C|nr:glutathione S-transferase N-terminal domain-containing protein [Candidatus Thiodiazotropha endoloripes]MCG7901232.1 glutathione S-transferase N-terminal domain-containing protein [Candidatus Thiodiazotropha weberae]MCG7993553.1 glutathione S-transferase N-terminal domain-containing protein [Candidatus Thiodiazotropha lotti]MCG7914448.1 glutathione S-transferase N-terminal domain-containing protein [Candidatus Thiodiazotropha weberae]MCG7997928.1 glutathione S-transferase N-terminal domain-co